MSEIKFCYRRECRHSDVMHGKNGCGIKFCLCREFLPAPPHPLPATPPPPAPSGGLTQEQLDGFREYLEWKGALHTPDCPCDDTCDCKFKRVNDAVYAVQKFVLATHPGKPETRTLAQQWIDADDFIAKHSARESEMMVKFPATLHCNCGAEFTADNRGAITDLFVRHVVMEAFALAPPIPSSEGLRELATLLANEVLEGTEPHHTRETARLLLAALAGNKEGK